MNEITYDEWLETYQPVTDDDGLICEVTDASEIERLYFAHRLWTEMDDGSIQSGWRFVNRVRHIATHLPHEGTSGFTVVLPMNSEE